MPYKLTKHGDIPQKEKFEIRLDVYPNIGNCGFVVVDTETGHNQEFYNVKSSFNYIILEGEGNFFLDDEAISVKRGDFISISEYKNLLQREDEACSYNKSSLGNRERDRD